MTTLLFFTTALKRNYFGTPCIYWDTRYKEIYIFTHDFSCYGTLPHIKSYRQALKIYPQPCWIRHIGSWAKDTRRHKKFNVIKSIKIIYGRLRNFRTYEFERLHCFLSRLIKVGVWTENTPGQPHTSYKSNDELYVFPEILPSTRERAVNRLGNERLSLSRRKRAIKNLYKTNSR